MGVETISEFEKWSEFIFEQVAEAQVGQGTERGDYRIRRIKMKGLLGESLCRDVQTAPSTSQFSQQRDARG